MTAASAILNAMDDSVKPCDDFYQFACGGWIKSHPIPAGESEWNRLNALDKQNKIVVKELLGERPFHSLKYCQRLFSVITHLQSAEYHKRVKLHITD